MSRGEWGSRRSGRLPIAAAARAGLLRSDDEERASLARAAVADGFTTPATVAIYIMTAAPERGCDEAQARAALRRIGRYDLAGEEVTL